MHVWYVFHIDSREQFQKRQKKRFQRLIFTVKRKVEKRQVSYHGKCFTAGKELLAIGSFNWDMRSAYLDTELMLVVDSPELNQQMSEYMQEYQEDALGVKYDSSYELKEGQKPRTISKKRERRKDLLKIVDGIFRYLF